MAYSVEHFRIIISDLTINENRHTKPINGPNRGAPCIGNSWYFGLLCVCIPMKIPHFAKVDRSRIEAVFSADGEHRSMLYLPFFDRPDSNTLCVIGQNPSLANADHADKTIQYIERFVFDRFPHIGMILMVNLYSRIDTKKDKTASPNDPSCDLDLRRAIAENNEFLLVFGELKNKGVYRFRDRAAELSSLFVGKVVHKIDIGSPYAPHPGNPRICYSNVSFGTAPHEF